MRTASAGLISILLGASLGAATALVAVWPFGWAVIALAVAMGAGTGALGVGAWLALR